MFELLVIAAFCWLFFKCLGLMFRLTWGAAQIIASLLFAVAIPTLLGCLFFAGGVILLVPLALISLAFGVLKSCI